jgi:patatin-like phospholipase/acyl hydrolase
MKKILSIDGGGIRGIVAVLMLKALEKKLQRKIVDSFDMFAGTSTGALIALMLCSGQSYSIEDIFQTYLIDSDKIFSKRWQSFNGWVSPKYSSDVSSAYFKNVFGDLKTSDLKNHIFIPSFDMKTFKPLFFTKDKKTHPDIEYYLSDICSATTAAPTFFSPACISSVCKKHEHICIDGGFVANNPSLYAAIETMKTFDVHPEDIVIVSVGTGMTKYIKGEHVKTWGKIQWASPVSDILIDGNNESVVYACGHYLGAGNFFRLQIDLKPYDIDTSMDNIDPKNMIKMISYAQDAMYTPEFKKTLINIVNALT